MGLIHDDEVVIVDGRHGFPVIVEDAFYHSLYGGHLNTGFPFNPLIFQPLDVVDVCQRHQILQLDLFEYIQCLLPQSGTVHQEQDAFEPACL